MTLDCSRIAKEIAMVSRFFVEQRRRRCFILASDKNEKDHKNLRSKLMHLSMVCSRMGWGWGGGGNPRELDSVKRAFLGNFTQPPLSWKVDDQGMSDKKSAILENTR